MDDEQVTVEGDALDERPPTGLGSAGRRHVDRAGPLDGTDPRRDRDARDTLGNRHPERTLGGRLEAGTGPSVRGAVEAADHLERDARRLGRRVERVLGEVDALDPDEQVDAAALRGGGDADHPDAHPGLGVREPAYVGGEVGRTPPGQEESIVRQLGRDVVAQGLELGGERLHGVAASLAGQPQQRP